MTSKPIVRDSYELLRFDDFDDIDDIDKKQKEAKEVKEPIKEVKEVKEDDFKELKMFNTIRVMATTRTEFEILDGQYFDNATKQFVKHTFDPKFKTYIEIKYPILGLDISILGTTPATQLCEIIKKSCKYPIDDFYGTSGIITTTRKYHMPQQGYIDLRNPIINMYYLCARIIVNKNTHYRLAINIPTTRVYALIVNSFASNLNIPIMDRQMLLHNNAIRDYTQYCKTYNILKKHSKYICHNKSIFNDTHTHNGVLIIYYILFDALYNNIQYLKCSKKVIIKHKINTHTDTYLQEHVTHIYKHLDNWINSNYVKKELFYTGCIGRRNYDIENNIYPPKEFHQLWNYILEICYDIITEYHKNNI